MELCLNDRFLSTALPPFSFFLSATGVFQFGRVTKWKRRFFHTRSVVLLVLCMQSNFYIAFKRIRLLTDFTEFIKYNNVRDLASAMDRSAMLVVDSVVHVALFLTIKPTIDSFLKILEQVDHDLKRPNLSRVHQVSFIGLIYTIFTVSVQ